MKNCYTYQELLENLMDPSLSKEELQSTSHFLQCLPCQKNGELAQRRAQEFQNSQKQTTLQASLALKEATFQNLRSYPLKTFTRKHPRLWVLLVLIVLVLLFAKQFFLPLEKDKKNSSPSLSVLSSKENSYHLLANAFNSELNTMLQQEEQSEINFPESESDILAEDYLEDLIFNAQTYEE
jgi:hypothetical protein